MVCVKLFVDAPRAFQYALPASPGWQHVAERLWRHVILFRAIFIPSTELWKLVSTAKHSFCVLFELSSSFRVATLLDFLLINTNVSTAVGRRTFHSTINFHWSQLFKFSFFLATWKTLTYSFLPFGGRAGAIKINDNKNNFGLWPLIYKPEIISAGGKFSFNAHRPFVLQAGAEKNGKKKRKPKTLWTWRSKNSHQTSPFDMEIQQKNIKNSSLLTIRRELCGNLFSSCQQVCFAQRYESLFRLHSECVKNNFLSSPWQRPKRGF